MRKRYLHVLASVFFLFCPECFAMDVTNADQARQLAEQALKDRHLTQYNSLKPEPPIERMYGWEFPLERSYPSRSMVGIPHSVGICRDGVPIFLKFFDIDKPEVDQSITNEMAERRRKQHPE